MYAFIEEEECSKEEETFGQSWEIAQISYFVFLRVFAVARAELGCYGFVGGGGGVLCDG